MVNGRPLHSEATLRLGVDPLSNLLQSLQCYTGEHFPQDAQQRNPSVVVTVAAITLVLVEGDDICIAHVLGHISFLPALTEELIEVVQERGLGTL